MKMITIGSPGSDWEPSPEGRDVSRPYKENTFSCLSVSIKEREKERERRREGERREGEREKEQWIRL